MRMKIVFLMIGTSLATVLCITVLWTHTLLAESEEQLADYRTQLQHDVDVSLKNETEIVVSMIDKIYQSQQAGELTEPQAKKLAADVVRDLRYDDGKGYFWIDTEEGVNVVLLGRDVEGKSRIDLVDPNGVHFIQEMLKNGKQTGGGYTDLSFPKPGETTPLPKRNYTTTFAPYHWVLGTGIWIDQIDKLVAAQKEVIDANLYESLGMTALISLLIELLCIVLAIFCSNRLASPIVRVTERLTTLAAGDFRHNPSLEVKIQSEDEIGRMSKALDTLQHNVRHMMKQAIQAAEEITLAVRQLNQSADQSATVSSQIAGSMSKVAGSCNEQFAEMDRAKTQIGTLEQHIDGADGTHTNPTILSDHRFIRHSVRVETDSHLERALTPVLTDSELVISSAHHQRVARLAEGLQISAYAPDGTIEAIESIDAPIIGVQWHPEDPAADISQLHALLGHLDARRAPRLERASTTLVA